MAEEAESPQQHSHSDQTEPPFAPEPWYTDAKLHEDKPNPEEEHRSLVPSALSPLEALAVEGANLSLTPENH